MKRTAAIALLVLTGVLGRPAPAEADVTFFLGIGTSPEARSTKGFAIGMSMLVVGFEFEYGNTVQKEELGAPGVKTGMFNALVMTPTKHTLYVTAGGGLYREELGPLSETSFGTNIGGGIKFTLVNRLQARFDYRLFNLRGSPLYKRPQRFYAGLNLAF